MTNLDELVALEQKIAVAKERGERGTRNLWITAAFFGLICFSWLSFIPKVNPGLNNLPFFGICAFGIVAIIVLVSGDLLFFNQTFAWQEELELKLSTRAGQLLGLDPKNVSLRKSNLSKQYVLMVSLERTRIVSEQIVDDVKVIQLTFRLNVETFHDLFALLEAHKSQLTRL